MSIVALLSIVALMRIVALLSIVTLMTCVALMNSASLVSGVIPRKVYLNLAQTFRHLLHNSELEKQT